MLTLSLILNLTLLIVTAVVFLYYLVQRKIAKQLFVRAWNLELRLMKLYDLSTEQEVKDEIQKIIGNIKPL